VAEIAVATVAQTALAEITAAGSSSSFFLFPAVVAAVMVGITTTAVADAEALLKLKTDVKRSVFNV